MPHERIQPHTSPDIDLGVSWGRDGQYVQVATTTESAERIELFRQALEYQKANGGPLMLGLFADLGRGQINQLIRTLRRARDQAFGADE